MISLLRHCAINIKSNGGLFTGKGLSRIHVVHEKISGNVQKLDLAGRGHSGVLGCWKLGTECRVKSLAQGPNSDNLVEILAELISSLQRSFHRCFFGGGHGGAEQKMTLEDIAKGIKEREYKRIVVMAGAGISTPSGIPDFRSPGSGLYDNLQKYNLPYPEAIFEINYFHYNPRPFFALAKELYPGNYRPNLTHYFIRLLHDKGQLLRMYTQNIDGLERMSGIPAKKLVEAHGTFMTATCTVCRRGYQGEDLRSDVLEGTVPHCSQCKGVIKPDVVFFGEELPQHFFLYLTDFPMADLLIVMGTSLEVEPFASLSGAVRGSVSRLLINRDLVGPFVSGVSRHSDVAELGDVVSGVRKLADALGWMPELEALMTEVGQKASKKSEE